MKMTPMSDEYISLSEKNILLQATILRNTDQVIGLCVYTGFGRLPPFSQGIP
jgi:hypothetical protein